MKQVEGWYVPTGDTALNNLTDAGYPIFGATQFNTHRQLLGECGLPNKRTALDIGAYVGVWSKFLSGEFTSVKAYEPVSSVVECFNKNLEGVSNVTIEQKCMMSLMETMNVVEAGTKDADAYDTQYARRSTTATKTNRTVKIQPDGKPGTDTMEQYTAGDYGSFFLSYDASWGADNYGNYPESMGRKVTGVLERDSELTSIDNENPSTVDFIHLCVNGMERLVLQGGDDLIIAQKPVIAYQAYDPKLDLYSHKTTSFDYQEGDYIEPVTLSKIEIYLNELGYAVSTFTGFSTYGITYYIAKQG